MRKLRRCHRASSRPARFFPSFRQSASLLRPRPTFPPPLDGLRYLIRLSRLSPPTGAAGLRYSEPSVYRTHTCGQLRTEHVGQRVTLCGWVNSYRDFGGGLFIDLRDRYGKTQVVFGPESAREPGLARSLRSEFVIRVTGQVAHRPEGTINPKLTTGEIEVYPEPFEILNKSQTPPLQPGGRELPNEDLRLKYRYLDLRRPEMQQILLLRHQIIRGMRTYFDEQGFINVETPCSAAARPRAPAITWCPAESITGTFTPCRSRRSSTSKS